jgi:hypothetical protein
MTNAFTLVAAPSMSRPQISEDKFQEDATQIKELMGESGIAGFTEVSHEPIKQIAREVFGKNRAGLAASDCPIVWTDDFVRVSGGVEFGAKGIRRIAPDRHTTWTILLRNDGLRVGVIAVHMHPGGWRPRGAQRPVAWLIRRRWRQHYRKIQDRIAYLSSRCDLVVMVGDINHPGLTTWPGLYRISSRGLLYVGVSQNAGHGNPTPHPQNADHDAVSVPIRPGGKHG